VKGRYEEGFYSMVERPRAAVGVLGEESTAFTLGTAVISRSEFDRERSLWSCCLSMTLVISANVLVDSTLVATPSSIRTSDTRGCERRASGYLSQNTYCQSNEGFREVLESIPRSLLPFTPVTVVFRHLLLLIVVVPTASGRLAAVTIASRRLLLVVVLTAPGRLAVIRTRPDLLGIVAAAWLTTVILAVRATNVRLTPALPSPPSLATQYLCLAHRFVFTPLLLATVLGSLFSLATALEVGFRVVGEEELGVVFFSVGVPFYLRARVVVLLSRGFRFAPSTASLDAVVREAVYGFLVPLGALGVPGRVAGARWFVAAV